MLSLMKRFIKEEDGQTATEYMLIIGVIVVGLIVAAKVFLGSMKEGITDLSWGIKDIFGDATKDLKGLK